MINASPRDAAAVTGQLGPALVGPCRDPDITVEFTDRIPLSSAVRYVGVDDAGFTDDAFLVLRGSHKSRVKVQIPFHEIGRECRIVCESGLSAVPFLVAILNLTALGKGFVPLHASAFTYRGTGVLVTGWARGGKSETLVAFAAKGAEYVGDEWVYLSEDGQRMWGLPQAIKLWDWHLQDVPQYRNAIRPADRIRLRGLGVVGGLLNGWDSFGERRRSSPPRLLRRVSALVNQQRYVHVPPERLFRGGIGSLSGSPQRVFFVVSHDDPRVTVSPMAPEEIARRMVFSLQEERALFLSYYLKFRFAFPGFSNDLIERAEEIQRDLLLRALSGKEAFAVHHPYPVSLEALFEAMNPCWA